MSAKRVTGFNHNDRVPLHDGIPHETPITLYIMPSTECNFNCFYCVQHNGAPAMNSMRAKAKYMTTDIAKKVADSCRKFPEKIKRINIAGNGEPLMNREIADIVHILKSADIAKSTFLVTNAALLNEKTADGLISAGLDTLQVSIQGLNNQTYKEITSKTINIEQIISNIRYYHQNKRDGMTVYVKIIDAALKGGSPEEFYSMFEDVCDLIAVEHLSPFYSHLNEMDGLTVGMRGQEVNKDIAVCNYPFYSCMITPNGDVASCCGERFEVYGSLNDADLHEIWGGNRRRDFLIKQLNNMKNIDICANCKIPHFTILPNEVLDQYAESVLNQINEKWTLD